MSRQHLLIAAVLVILAAAAAATAIAIELGLAFQSESDSSDDVEVGDYIKAADTDGRMVAIAPVTYIQSQDRETYVLNNNVQSVRGTLEVGTEDNVDKGLTSIRSFQESGTWLFIEAMTLTTQRELYFTALVNASVSLSGTTVILISGTAEGMTATLGSQDSSYAGYKVWGVGSSVSGYVPSAHPGDSYKNFIVLVKDDSLSRLTHRYNVLKISSGANDTVNVDLITPRSIGATVISDGNWKVWNTDNSPSGYTLRSSDLYRSSEDAVSKVIFDSMTSAGVAGMQTNPITVYTGSYSFSIEMRYKSQISIDPTDYQGENMRSNVVFILSKVYSVTYVNTNGPSMSEGTVDYHAAFVSAAMNPSAGYNRATTVTVTMGGNPFTDFEYDGETGVVTIDENVIASNLVITAVHTPQGYTVTYVNTNGPEMSQGAAVYHAAFESAAMNPSTGYDRASTVTVTMGGSPFTKFSYNPTTGVVTIAAGEIAGNLVITAVHTLKQYTVTYNITNGSATGPDRIGHHTEFTATIAPSGGYVLPESITVTMGEESFDDFSYTQGTGVVTILSGKVDGNLVITVNAEPES